MEKKLMIEEKLKKFCLVTSGDDIFHSMSLYSYDYIKNFAPQTFKEVRYYTLESCKHFIVAKETKCYAEFARTCFRREVAMFTIHGTMCVVNDLDILKEIINTLKKGGKIGR